MNPKTALANRTARLVREASTPVYSTVTKPVVREHIMAVETDSMYGRHWSHMPDSEVDEHIARMVSYGDELSDIDHSAKCWCFKEGN